jgi:hypothetical protein
MAINNNCLYNAAIAGFMEAVLSGRQSVPGSIVFNYNTYANAAAAFAAQVDAGIPFDAAITTNASNTILAITTNTIAGAEFAKINLLHSICCGVMNGRLTTDTTQADYTAAATVAIAAYTAAVAVSVVP